MRARPLMSGVPQVTPGVLLLVVGLHAATKAVVFSMPFQRDVVFPIEWATGWAISGVSVAGLLTWAVVVGVGMMAVGRLRLGHLGLTKEAVLEAVPILLWVWILLQIPQALAGAASDTWAIAVPPDDVSVAVGKRLQQLIGAGLLEEVLYRGFLLTQVFGLLRSRWGRDRAMAGAVAATSIYFGLNHIPTALSLGLPLSDVVGYVVLSALVGLLLAGLFLRTGNLILAAGGHALLNDPLPYVQSVLDPALVSLVGLCAIVLVWPVLASRFSDVFAVGVVEGQPVI